jgi:hypothetical protein
MFYDHRLLQSMSANLGAKRRTHQDVNIHVRGTYGHWHFVDSRQYDSDQKKVLKVLVLLIVRVDEKYRGRGLFKQGWQHLQHVFAAQTNWTRLQVQSVKNAHLLAFLTKQPGATVKRCKDVTSVHVA